MPHPVESTFTLGGHRIAYSTYGEGPRVIVLVHGLLLSQRMHAELALVRFRRLLEADPGGAWVAERGGALTGVALALLRGDELDARAPRGRPSPRAAGR